MARPRKPTNILAFSGAFKKDPQRAASRANEPKPKKGIGEPPAHFNEAQAAIWRELVELIAESHDLRASDRVILEQFCNALLTMRSETEHTRGTAYDVKLGNLIKQFCTELGMTPASRSKVPGIPTDEKKDDSFAAV